MGKEEAKEKVGFWEEKKKSPRTAGKYEYFVR
jgi:hypothetical protein